MIRQENVHTADIAEWIDTYNSRLTTLRGLSLKKHQITGILDLAMRFRPVYQEWLEHQEQKPADDDFKYKHQEWAKREKEIAEQFGYLLAWNMGLGKTGTCLIALEMLSKFFPKMFEDRVPVIAIVPNSVKGVWSREFDKWMMDRTRMDINIVPPDAKNGNLWIAMTGFLKTFITVMSYDSLRLRVGSLRSLKFGVMVFDEIHYVKNHEAQRTRAAYWIDAVLRVGLSGTPITNRPNDFHAPLAILQGSTYASHNNKGDEIPIRTSEIWDSYAQFKRDYCVEKDAYGNVAGGKNLTPRGCRLCTAGCAAYCRKTRWLEPTEMAEVCNQCTDRLPIVCQGCDRPLHPRALYQVMNRLAGDDEELEPIQFIDRFHELTELQRKYYDQVKAGLVEYLSQPREESGWHRDGFNIRSMLAQLMYFRLICSDLRQFQHSIASKTGSDDSIVALAGLAGANILRNASASQFSGKLTEFKEMLEEDIDIWRNKVVIFTAFAVTAHLLEKDLAEYNPMVIDGQANQRRQTDTIVDKFQNDPRHRIVISTSAGFEGLTLTAANWAVLWGTIDWSPGKVLQAMKRVHRIGQTKQVYVVNLTAEETIEEKIRGMLEEKQRDFDAAIDGGAVSRTRAFWSKDEILSLV